MVYLKKLVFAPLFLISFATLTYLLAFLLASYNFIFSLSINSLIQLLMVALLITISSLFFAIFVTLAADWKIILGVGILAALMPLFFLETSLAIVFTVGISVSLLLTFLSLTTALKSYLTFKPEALLGPAIRHLSGLLILAFCLTFFLSTSKIIAQNGFQIPDSLIDTALKVAAPNLPNLTESPDLPQLSIPAEQIELLKQNPELLRQSGLDPAILDNLDQPKSPKAPQNLTQDLIKQTVKDQMQNLIKPYINFIPAGLAILLFLTLQSLTSIISLLIYPLLWITFYILEKTGFLKFEVEQRPVRKLVV